MGLVEYASPESSVESDRFFTCPGNRTTVRRVQAFTILSRPPVTLRVAFRVSRSTCRVPRVAFRAGPARAASCDCESLRAAGVERANRVVCVRALLQAALLAKARGSAADAGGAQSKLVKDILKEQQAGAAAGAGDKEADDAKKEGTGIRLGRLKKTGADKNKNFGLTDADLEQLRAAIQVGGEGGRRGAARWGAARVRARTPSERRRRIAAAAGIPLGWCDA